MQNVKLIKAVNIVKLKGKRIAAIVPATVNAVAAAREIKAKTVRTVKSWISERRENELSEKAASQAAMQGWRKDDDAPAKRKA